MGSRFCISCGEPLWLSVGHILEKRYRIISQLAAGGFGRTYLAENLHRFNERCVLKEFAPQVQGERALQKAKELFEREAGALHKLDHPQLPKFLEFFQTELAEGVSCLFLAQDYVEGETYCELLKSRRLREVDVTQLICHLIPVLSYIHSQGVIHRDISPDNLILRRSDGLPVLIDFGGIKQVAAIVARFTQLGQIPTRLGKQGYAPEEQMLQGLVFPSSDLYALAVTALVLLTGKEPQELYDNYQGWLWRREIKVSPQLETVLQKMLADKPSDRYQSASEVLQALQSPTTTPPSTNSQIRTINFVGSKPEPPPSYSPQQGGSTQVIITPTPYLSWLRPWVIKIAGVGLVGFMGMNAWAMVNSVLRSTQLLPVQVRTDTTTTAEQINKLLSRQQALGIKARFFITLVDDLFHRKHPELQGRSLKPAPNDANLRSDWYNIADELLNKLEQAQLSTAARRKLGSYGQQNYEIWKRQANSGERGYTIEQLREQTDQKFYQLFPQQRREKLNQTTFGQIWYAIAADKVSQLQTGDH